MKTTVLTEQQKQQMRDYYRMRSQWDRLGRDLSMPHHYLWECLSRYHPKPITKRVGDCYIASHILASWCEDLTDLCLVYANSNTPGNHPHAWVEFDYNQQRVAADYSNTAIRKPILVPVDEYHHFYNTKSAVYYTQQEVRNDSVPR